LIHLVHRDRLTGQLELETVQDRRLPCLGRNAGGDEVGVGHRPFRGVEQHPFELAHGDRCQFRPMLEQCPGFGDDRRVAVERGAGLARHFGAGVMFGLHIRGGAPLGLALDPVQRLVTGVHQMQELIRPFLNRRGHGRDCHQHEI
jgi:hypothetical protein